IKISSYWQLIVKGLIIVCAVLLDTQKGRIKFNKISSKNDTKRKEA
ncbi:MAG: ribose ABC transporter permease, partial [Catonella sp.]